MAYLDELFVALVFLGVFLAALLLSGAVIAGFGMVSTLLAKRKIQSNRLKARHARRTR